MAEAGLSGYESIGWYGVIAPAGTPVAIITRLNAAFVAALQESEVVARMRSVGSEPAPATAAEFAKYIRGEIAKWGDVIARSGAKSN
jgi:tripartite-type tricarboxylate transporter receptor subunit TctC